MKRIMEEWVIPGVVCLIPALITAWLFYDFSLGAILPVIGWIPSCRAYKKEQKREKLWELNLAYKDVLTGLENAMAVGYSPESSLRETGKSLEQLYGKEHAVCTGIRRMLKQMELGISMEQAFLEYGRECGVEDIRQLAETFAVAKRTGGNLGEVLRQTGGILKDKIELRRDLHGAIAAKRLEFRIMCIMPYGILLYLKLFAPSMTAGLYHSGFGIAFMSLMLLLYHLMHFWGENIIRECMGKPEGNK